MNTPHHNNGYIFRDARAENRAEVLAFTANTWEAGDYIEEVFNDWLVDSQGRFLVAEEETTGSIAAIDKLTMLSPTEAWFEGLRVHPDHRGRGLAGRLQRYMIGEAARLGVHTIRLLTLATNRPIHLAAYRDGFSLKFVVRFWKWEDSAPDAAFLDTGEAYKLRFAEIGEAALLHRWWRRSSAFRTTGLAHENWSFAETSPHHWEVAADEHRLLVKADALMPNDGMPPPTAMVAHRTDNHETTWVISALTALGEEWSPLARGLIAVARQAGIIKINGLLPDTQEIYSGLLTAGFVPDRDDERLCLFELSLVSK